MAKAAGNEGWRSKGIEKKKKRKEKRSIEMDGVTRRGSSNF